MFAYLYYLINNKKVMPINKSEEKVVMIVEDFTKNKITYTTNKPKHNIFERYIEPSNN